MGSRILRKSMLSFRLVKVMNELLCIYYVSIDICTVFSWTVMAFL